MGDLMKNLSMFLDLWYELGLRPTWAYAHQKDRKEVVLT